MSESSEAAVAPGLRQRADEVVRGAALSESSGAAVAPGLRQRADEVVRGADGKRQPERPSEASGKHDLPVWWQPLLDRLATAQSSDFTRLPVPEEGGRPSAVLVLLADGADGPDVLVLQRAHTLRTHAGQPAFPGGAADPGDADPAATALREAAEEVGLDPSTVTVVATLPPLYIPVSNFVVTPVLGWWRDPHEVQPVALEEVAAVARLPVTELADPANRLRVRHPSGWIGPAFDVGGLLVWGFTAGVISTLLDMGGWAVPWATDRVEDLPTAGTAPVL